MPSPYINPSYLINWPSNVAWETIPDIESTPQEQLFAQQQMCWTATRSVDNFAQQTLRASIYTEDLSAPSHRVGIKNGVARFVTSFFPIVEVISAEVAYSNGPPYTFQAVPAGYAIPEESPFSPYGTNSVGMATGGMNVIIIGGGYANWSNGRLGQRIRCTYINGWPHSGLLDDAPAGSTTLHIDDVTGWLNVMGTIPDVDGREFATVTAVSPDTSGLTTPTGPGIVTLSEPTLYAHQAGDLFTSLPETLLEATVWFALSQVLARGTNAIGAPPMPGKAQPGAGSSMDRFRSRAQELINPYKRQW